MSEIRECRAHSKKNLKNYSSTVIISEELIGKYINSCYLIPGYIIHQQDQAKHFIIIYPSQTPEEEVCVI